MFVKFTVHLVPNYNAVKGFLVYLHYENDHRPLAGEQARRYKTDP